MAKKQMDPARDVAGVAGGFPRGRLIWARLFEPEAMEEGQDKSYSCAIMFDEDADLSKLKRAFKAAQKDFFGEEKPRKLKRCWIDDPDEIEELHEEYDYIKPGSVILKMRRSEKYGAPQKWSKTVEPIESPSELYSGCYVVADVHFFGWERSGSRGVSCRLNGIQIVKDGEPTGGGKNDTEDSFAPVKGVSKRRRDDDDDDDDDDDI
jgi:hypothetical protein